MRRDRTRDPRDLICMDIDREFPYPQQPPKEAKKNEG